MAAVDHLLSPEEQIEALGSLSIIRVLAARGIKTVDPRRYLSISRVQMVAFFTRLPQKAESLLLNKKEPRPVNDALCFEARDGKFVVYSMDHGNERDHYWYRTLAEAAADFVAFHIGYAYPDGYGFENNA